MGEPLQAWDNRTEPDFQLSGMTPDGSDYSDTVRPLQPTPEAELYTTRLNMRRSQYQEALRSHELPAVLRFYVPSIRGITAEVAGTPIYPRHRVAMDDQADRDGSDIASFDPLMGVVAINPAEYDELDPPRDPLEVVDAVANRLAHAALGGTVDMYKSPDTGAYTPLYGTVWQAEGLRFGEALQEGVAAHIASLVRREMNLVATDETNHPALAPYHRPEGYRRGDIMAAGLDMINQAAGFGNGRPGIYEPLQSFAKNGRDVAAREEAAAIIRFAARGSGELTLGHLELPQPLPVLPLGSLHRIEDATDLELSRRPSAALS